MKLTIYQVDAFTDRLYAGNPAAVCPLKDRWPDDSLMQNIALENNLSETAFYAAEGGRRRIRWFTPTVEVDLCGHATLASAHVLYTHEGYKEKSVSFDSRSGVLTVGKEGDYLVMDFPSDTIERVVLSKDLVSCFERAPAEVYRGKTDYMLVFADEEEVSGAAYSLENIRRIKARGIIITAPGKECDFVSRFFAPRSGVDEDPVTGSSHTTLTPYWSSRLGRKELHARQLSRRGGALICRDRNERTEILGRAVTYLVGEINV